MHVITGAASGIGKEIAHAFSKEGAKVVIADLDQQSADAVADELGTRTQRTFGDAIFRDLFGQKS